MENLELTGNLKDTPSEGGVEEMIGELETTIDHCHPEEALELLDDCAVSIGEVIEELEEELRSVRGADEGSESEFLAKVNVLSDLNLNVSVVLGSRKILLEEIFNLEAGSTIDLDRDTHQPLDVLVNGRLFARGEGLIVNERLAVRITEIIRSIEEINQT